MQRLGLRLSSASTRAPSAVLSLGRRGLHQPQQLLYPVEEGLGNFLPPDALKVQVEWQDGLLERLNEQVACTPPCPPPFCDPLY
jgi:Fe-Mn family superoxide dismutase